MQTSSLPRAASTVLTFAALALGGIAAGATGATAQTPCGGFITVGSGDTFLEIAERCGVTIPALLAQNPGVVDEDDLEVGDRLRVPAPDAAQPSPVQACGASYTVRPGDTVAEIARKCGLTIPLLVAANGPLPDPLGIHAGTTLRIPDVPAAAVTDPATLVAPGRSAVAVGGDTADVAAAEEAGAARDSAAIPAEDLVRVEGVLEAGDHCMVVRAPDGERVGIAGEIEGDFAPGQRVVLMGVPAGEHDCHTSRTVQLRILYRPGG